MSKSMEIKAGLVILVGVLIGLLGLFLVGGGGTPCATRRSTRSSSPTWAA